VCWRRMAAIVIALPLASCRTAGPVRRVLTPDQKAQGEKALLLLQNSMKATEPEIRVAAALAWGRLGNPAAKSVCLAALADSSDQVKIAAAYSLWRLGDGTGVPVVRSIASREPLADDGEPLFKTRAEFDARVRAGALRTYADMLGPASASLLESLRADPDPSVGEAAVVSLLRLGRPDGESVRAILAAALTEDRVRRLRAIRLLGQLRGPDVIDALKHLASMRDREIQAEALDALGEQESVLALPEIESALAEIDGKVRRSAAKALSRVRSQAAAPSLNALLAEPQPLRLYGWLGLRRLAEDPPIGIPAEAAASPEAVVRLDSVEALELEGAGGLPTLERLLDDGDSQVRVRAALSTLIVLRGLE
jgi:HEAT repeat protein